MDWTGSVTIRCPVEAAWRLLDDVQDHAVRPGSPVVAMTKAPAGPVAVGTAWREIVRVAPRLTLSIDSVVTAVEPARRLEERFRGPGMTGWLSYRLEPVAGGCRLDQREHVEFVGALRPVAPIAGRLLRRRLEARLADLAALLERPDGPGAT